MAEKGANQTSHPLEQFSHWMTEWAGSSWAFAIAVLVILVWAVTGPIFRFSDTWQLIINTGTTIVTFLMVFLIQRSQNKESRAVQLKLNEVIAALQGASNRLVNAEELSEEELRSLHERYEKLASITKTDATFSRAHSVEETESRDQPDSNERPMLSRPAK
jgi:low affinity Fe/Cu permease